MHFIDFEVRFQVLLWRKIGQLISDGCNRVHQIGNKAFLFPRQENRQMKIEGG